MERVYAEAAGSLHAEREVELTLALELVALAVVRDDLAEHVFGVARHELVGLRDRHELVVNANQRGRRHLQVKVGATGFDDALQRSFKSKGHTPLLSGARRTAFSVEPPLAELVYATTRRGLGRPQIKDAGVKAY